MNTGSPKPEFRPDLQSEDVLKVIRRVAARDIPRKMLIDEDELAHEVWAEAIANLDHFRGANQAEFIAWLNAIARNRVLDHLRRSKIKKRSQGNEQSVDKAIYESLSSDEPDPESAALLKESSAALLAALDRLPADQRQAVRLRHLDGMPLSKIAETMEKTEGAVAGLLRRGIERLRSDLRMPVSVTPSEMQRATSDAKYEVDIQSDLSVDLWIDTGDATTDDIQELFHALSDLNRAAGGSGLSFIRGKDSVHVVEGVN